MNVFLTGASGFIGRKLLTHLLDRLGPADTLYVLSRKPIDPPDPRAVVIRGTLEDVDAFGDILVRCAYVFHCAALASFGLSADYDAVNVTPVRKMTELLKAGTNPVHFVFISTIGAVDRQPTDRCDEPIGPQSKPHPRSAYGRSKLNAEECLRASGLPYTIVRPAWVYGRDMRHDSHINTFVSLTVRNSPLRLFSFPGRVSVIHVEDLCRSLVNIIGNDAARNRTYFAETEAVSIGEMFRVIRAAVHERPSSQIRLSIPPLKYVVRLFHGYLPLTVACLFIDYLVARDDTFRRDLGPHSCVPFHQGIADVVATNARVCGHWVITGANSGIGLSLAALLDAKNVKLVLVDRQTDVLHARFPHQKICRLDLADEAAIRREMPELGRLKIVGLVNNAGVGSRGGLAEISADAALAMINVNIRAPLLMTKLLLENIAENRGTIVNIASSVAYHPLPFMSVYAASKAFMANWSEALGYELRPLVRVVTVSPSGTRTNFQESAGVQSSGARLLDPQRVARRIVSAIEGGSPLVIYMNAASRLLLLISCLLPRSVALQLWGRIFERYR